ncbi:flavin reductase [Ethanoligenens harbinense]|uniref:Flavin reductase domain protein FMN-binding protein n=1 Tax=Ethanoligenens harbinense (strain DSM 18485 / JCM 12961 / CGMCC 1.5033 / YUAN-3) TaxID=663278 RepID=E6U660_ETHHY|nr:flavin reductase [Ethanoligenens harbinense]ADU25739.1 flavin reductase domain protein FMN-binding protein [Ethanoligenens harbinense YUAN-3]AVQ94909.1 flavin reductase [Ethanoligenens harbinense YUAN-3]AYF37601.1 flavin reductase [Ethanoligenens harbinense]AYF40321.1 flavin reductase [Ethanoligenens harbinense]QCN91157.1 flavin reductase family protein [Ethanoligenens harbinense]
MAALHEIPPEEISGNVFDLIGKQWTLITAGTESRFNTMTASWGGLGVLWGGPAAFIFVRPQRYTLEFLHQNPKFTLSFYDESHRKALNLLGSKSGRDGDKVAEAGLTPVFADGTTYFEEAGLVLFCEKWYESKMQPSGIKKPTAINPFYPQKDYHHMLVGKITKVLQA